MVALALEPLSKVSVPVLGKTTAKILLLTESVVTEGWVENLLVTKFHWS